VPQFTAAVPSKRDLELVSLKGTQKFVVRDITDILHATTVSTLENISRPQFVSASELSFLDGKKLVRAPLSGSPRTVVAEFTPACSAGEVAWSPDGTSVAYVVNGDELDLISRGRKSVVALTPGIPARGCVACQDLFDMRLAYSTNGDYISLVQNWGGPVMRIWTSDGKLIKSVDEDPSQAKSSPTMSVWSGNSLYYRDEKGVEVWHTNGDQSLLLPVAWIRPKASPGGGQILYAVRDDSATAHVYLFGTGTARLQELGKSRSQPAFLNGHLIWYQEERPCAQADPSPCPNVHNIPSGKTFVYDLQDNTETESVIAAVWDVWPHGA
jgi:hypothetical protein